MKTCSLRGLRDEDLALCGVHSADLFWQQGSAISYLDAGREDNLIFLMTGGERTYLLPEKESAPLTVQAGDLMLMPADIRYQSMVTSPQGNTGIVLGFTLMNRQGEPLRLGEKLTLLPRELGAQVRPLMEEIAACCLQSGARLRVMGRLSQLLMMLCEADTPPVDGELMRAVRYMETHLDRVIPLDEAAALCHMSPATFTRRFRAATGDSPAAYHRRLRLAKGRELLSGGLYSVEQVALLLGFFDSAHFCHAYAACFGESPRGRRRAVRP